MFIAKNTKKQGDIGVGIAIAYFVVNEYTVSIPLTDSQPYDLIVEDKNGKLSRIQVKTTSFKGKSGYYFVSLTIKGGNRTSKGKIKEFDPTEVDYIFIVTDTEEKYLIPSFTCNNSITLNKTKDKFRV